MRARNCAVFPLLLSFSVTLAASNIPGYDGPCVSVVGAQGESELDCSAVTTASHLGGLPSSFYSVIRLSGTSLTVLPFQSFGAATAQSYFITDNSLTRIEYGALGLTDLPKTKLLAFSNNKINYFPFKYLKQFTNLKELLLHTNSLSSVPANGYFPASLENIDLSYNKIEFIGEFAFAGEESREHLRSINLRFNRLTTVSSNAFYHLGEGVILEMNHNRLHHIEDNAFGDRAGGDLFSTMILQDNNLKTLNEGAFRYYLQRAFDEGKTVRLSVLDNDFRCDCSLQWLYRDGTKYGGAYKSMVPDLICQENGVQFWDLLPSYFDVCTKRKR